jgi:hypothetical protein
MLSMPDGADLIDEDDEACDDPDAWADYGED